MRCPQCLQVHHFILELAPGSSSAAEQCGACGATSDPFGGAVSFRLAHCWFGGADTGTPADWDIGCLRCDKRSPMYTGAGKLV